MMVDEELVRRIYPARSRTSREGENGRLLVIGGSWLHHGAPVLASLGAQRAGVDLLYLAVPKALTPAVRAISPDLIVFPLPDLKFTKGSARRLLKRMPEVDAVLIGPGLGKGSIEGAKVLLQELLDSKLRYVLDADALYPELLPFVKGRAVITPHIAEFKRLFGVDISDKDVEDRSKYVMEAAMREGVTILLKGPTNVISDGNEVYINATGNPGMTVGGVGHVLSGIVAAFVARGLPLLHAAILGAFFNGLAGDRAREKYGFHFTASMMVEELPHVMKPFDKEV